MGQLRTAILISGRGSNMQALIRSCQLERSPAKIVAVISDQADAMGLKIAQEYGIPASAIPRTRFPSRDAFEAALEAALQNAGAEFICLAGFMRILSPEFVSRRHNRILNIHPSLLPAFPGLDTHQRALEAGVRITGCTVHFVRAAMDQGPIVIQAAVPVLPQDTAKTLAARVLKLEHEIYPAALEMVARRQLALIGDEVFLHETGIPQQCLINPPIPVSA